MDLPVEALTQADGNPDKCPPSTPCKLMQLFYNNKRSLNVADPNYKSIPSLIKGKGDARGMGLYQ